MGKFGDFDQKIMSPHTFEAYFKGNQKLKYEFRIRNSDLELKLLIIY